jgi:hypothetical protein
VSKHTASKTTSPVMYLPSFRALRAAQKPETPASQAFKTLVALKKR